MADRSSQTLPTPTAEQRRVTAETFDRARQVIQTGNYDYAIQLLRTCCQLDPGNFLFRQTLRRCQKEKYGNNLRGSRFAFFSKPRFKARVKAAKASRDYLRVIETCEDVFARDPWDLGTSMDAAEAFEALGSLDLAVFTLDQARQKFPRDATLNRALARLFEKRGDFQKAIALWQLVQQVNPRDVEAATKAKDLAASETIARGGYEQVASGTKESPIIGRIESQSTAKQEKIARDTASLLKRIEADPTEPELYLQLAALYRRNGELDRASAALQQGLGPTGGHFKLQSELLDLDLLPLRENLERVEAKLKAITARGAEETDSGDEQQTPEELKALRAKLQKEIAAREVSLFRMKTERFPTDASHRVELGLRLMKLDKLDEAITELQAARRDEKWKGRAAMYLGVCFQKRNNWRLAQRNFEEALQFLSAPAEEPARKEVLFQLATGSAENGELDRAMDLGHELANIDFGYKNIGQLLDDWHTRAKQEVS